MFIIHRSNVIYISWKIPRTEERHFTKTFDKGVIEVPNFAPRNQTLRLFIIPTARDQKGPPFKVPFVFACHGMRGSRRPREYKDFLTVQPSTHMILKGKAFYFLHTIRTSTWLPAARFSYILLHSPM